MPTSPRTSYFCFQADDTLVEVVPVFARYPSLILRFLFATLIFYGAARVIKKPPLEPYHNLLLVLLILWDCYEEGSSNLELGSRVHCCLWVSRLREQCNPCTAVGAKLSGCLIKEAVKPWKITLCNLPYSPREPNLEKKDRFWQINTWNPLEWVIRRNKRSWKNNSRSPPETGIFCSTSVLWRVEGKTGKWNDPRISTSLSCTQYLKKLVQQIIQ